VRGRLAGGLLLAAGAGRRLGMPKALVELDGELLVERGVRLLADGGCAPVIVVVGAGADEVLARAALGEATVIVNAHWDTGMGSSLRMGLTALADTRPAVGAAVIALVDQPFVRPEAVRRLRRAWTDGAVAAVATYAGAPRNPVLLDRSLWEAAADSATGDRGARAFLTANPDLVSSVPCDDCARGHDIDTVADLAAARGRRPRARRPATG
jgi:CTP:molybdopterin cytidylyltransferase MocA